MYVVFAARLPFCSVFEDYLSDRSEESLAFKVREVWVQILNLETENECSKPYFIQLCKGMQAMNIFGN